MQSPFAPSFLQSLGPQFDSLPFSSPAEAEATLHPRAHRRLIAFRQLLAGSGLDDDPAFAAVRAMSALFPASSVLLHPGAYPTTPPWMLHNFSGYPSIHGVIGAPSLHQARCYQPRDGDPFANLPVALPSLLSSMKSEPQRAENMLQLIAANDNHYQLRMVIYQASILSLYVGIYRRRTAKIFNLEDHALLLAARPELTQWIETSRLVGLRPLGEGTIGDLTEVMTEPMVLILRDRIVHASPSARALLSHRGATTELMQSLQAQKNTLLRVGGEPAKLVRVMPIAESSSSSMAIKIRALPPSLYAVAVCLAQGLCDKDIADRTGHSLATVRTYVTRVFERLGVHDRRALMRRVDAGE